MKKLLLIVFLGLFTSTYAQVDYEFFIDIRFREIQKPNVIFEVIKPMLDEDAIENDFKLEKIDIIKYDEPEKQNLLTVSLKILFSEDGDAWEYCGDLKKDIALELINQKISFLKMDCRF